MAHRNITGLSLEDTAERGAQFTITMDCGHDWLEWCWEPELPSIGDLWDCPICGEGD